MKRSKAILALFVAAVAILLIAGAFVWGKKHVEAPGLFGGSATSSASSSSAADNLVTIAPQLISVGETGSNYTVSGSYPQFSQANDAFNEEIATMFLDGIADFKSSAASDDRGQGGFTYSIETNVVQSNADYVSVVIRAEGYAGGAHPYHTIATFNYDVKTQKELALPDVGLTYDVASADARADLEKQFKDVNAWDDNTASMLNDGTQPTSDNFGAFTFTPDTITLYFSEYQVAPYSYGESTVDVPRQ